MLIRKKIENAYLPFITEEQCTYFVKKKILKQSEKGESIKLKALQDKEEILLEARKLADSLVKQEQENARLRYDNIMRDEIRTFSIKTDVFFKDWEHQKTAWQNSLVDHTKQYIRQACVKFLTELTFSERIDAMLNQLKIDHISSPAVLYCSLAMKPNVETWLNEHAWCNWEIQIDSKLKEHEVILSTMDANLSISWEGVINKIIP